MKLQPVDEHPHPATPLLSGLDAEQLSAPEPPQEDIPSYSLVDDTPPPPEFEDYEDNIHAPDMELDPGTELAASSSQARLAPSVPLTRAPTYALIDPRTSRSSMRSQNVENSSSLASPSSGNDRPLSSRPPSIAETRRPRSSSSTSFVSSSSSVHESAAELYGTAYGFPTVPTSRHSRPGSARSRPPSVVSPTLSSPAAVTPENTRAAFPIAPLPPPVSHTPHQAPNTPSARQGVRTQSLTVLAPPGRNPALPTHHRPSESTTLISSPQDSPTPNRKLRKPPRQNRSNTMPPGPFGEELAIQQPVPPPPVPQQPTPLQTSRSTHGQGIPQQQVARLPPPQHPASQPVFQRQLSHQPVFQPPAPQQLPQQAPAQRPVTSPVSPQFLRQEVVSQQYTTQNAFPPQPVQSVPQHRVPPQTIHPPLAPQAVHTQTVPQETLLSNCSNAPVQQGSRMSQHLAAAAVGGALGLAGGALLIGAGVGGNGDVLSNIAAGVSGLTMNASDPTGTLGVIPMDNSSSYWQSGQQGYFDPSSLVMDPSQQQAFDPSAMVSRVWPLTSRSPDIKPFRV
ncbi:hypothetical protein HYDPIDRAFT_117598 [Hydnomerulius pinastri MD-312]|uniref:Unplaced genomic scaffold scaffold_42, whole genome shotgun sequence n=1 Tax=Hydnomerulius pinastri MD-312 TaxID=994086 RepID=A0A0C9WAH2_9AGAM|nr:hypothetical protein HYDPIDRAFT_117598 [Hydnomerulius pinastri MD-312]